MKALIFDVDNTLIMWKDEFIFALRNVLKKMGYNLTNDEINKLDKVIDSNELYLDTLNKEKMLSYINENFEIKFPKEFLDNLIIEQGNCVYDDKELIEVIKYLSEKYDLFVISNWFTETQKIRLEKMGIAKYFKEIIGADENLFKPHKKVFDCILNKYNYNFNECVYIGDKLDIDILLPLSLGMDAYWVTNEENNSYKTIKNVYELKYIL